jgi:hypothetical protein
MLPRRQRHRDCIQRPERSSGVLPPLNSRSFGRSPDWIRGAAVENCPRTAPFFHASSAGDQRTEL